METIEKLEELRPTAGSSYSLGWRRMFEYFLYAFLVIVFMGIISAPVGWTYEVQHIRFPIMFNFFSLFTLAYFLFLASPLKYGAKKVLLSIIRKDKIDLNELFYGFKDYLNIVLANILMGALIGIGIAFLIVPGIIIACRLAFVPYLVIDKKLDAVKAVEESWKITKGHGWTIFLMALMVVPIFFAGLLVLGVGVIFSIIWINLAFTAIYAIVIAKKEKAEAI